MQNNKMRTIFAVSLFVLSAQAFACTQNICPGDKVYRGSIYKDGGIVVYIDHDLASLRVWDSTRQSEVIVVENIENLDLTKGCITNFCVGNRVELISTPKVPMAVVGVNPISGMVLIKGPHYLFEHAPSELVKI